MGLPQKLLLFQQMFERQYQSYLAELEAALDASLPLQPAATGGQVVEAARYSLLAGGKRIRPVLLLATLDALKSDRSIGLPFACAIEMIHTYSLIHDDLPCMDNDDFRRGRLTCHRQFTEAIAVLAGDLLLNRAFEIMARAEHVSPAQTLDCLSLIASASGSLGMIGGQMLDLSAEGRKVSAEELKQIHRQKTGALIKAPVMAACTLTQTTTEISGYFEHFSDQLGLAFQIQDDILDVTASAQKLGKSIGKDQRDEKSTYVTLYGLDQAQERLKSATAEAHMALESLTKYGVDCEFLKQLTQFLLKRDY